MTTSREPASALKLFSELAIRDLTVANRVMVSPLCMYSATAGLASDFHLVHLGRFALGGAGLVFVEATAVEPRGRISHQDLGLWNDDQQAALAPIASFLKSYGSVPAIQLAHAGRKASASPLWQGGQPRSDRAVPPGEANWTVVGPGDDAAGPGWHRPEAMSPEGVRDSVQWWRQAAARAVDAGFEVIGLHGAHGYLLHSFQSPVSNQRNDDYGGSVRNRLRYPLEVVDAVRSVMPAGMPLFYRVSAVDGVAGGISLADTVAFARELGRHGVDVIDCSSGGIVTDRRYDTRVRRGFGFHAPYSTEIRQRTGLLVATVGLVVDGAQAEALLEHGAGDLIAVGRQMLEDPAWPHHARAQLTHPDYSAWNVQAGSALQARLELLAELDLEGETPMSRYTAAESPT